MICLGSVQVTYYKGNIIARTDNITPTNEVQQAREHVYLIFETQISMKINGNLFPVKKNP